MPAASSPRPWLMLGLALLAQVAASIVAQGVPTLAPFLQADLGLTRAEVGMFNSALVAGSLVAMFGAGWVVDIKGERAALASGTALMGLACFAVLATSSFLPALAVLFAVGIGSAFPTPAGSKAVTSWFPIEQRGFAMGVRQTGIPLGGALAAATLPHIAARWGWRPAVVLGGLACLAAAACCQAWYRNPPTTSRAPHVRHRLPRLADFLTRDIALIGLCGALGCMGQFVLITYLAIFLRETQGIAVTVSATLLVLAQLAGAAGRILWGVASDRVFHHRRRPALMLPIALSALGAVVLGWLPPGTPLWVLVPLVMLQAFCALGWHGNWIALVAETAGPEKQGRTVGIAMSIMYPGIILLPPLFGYYVDRTHSWSGAWSLLAVVLVTAVALLAPVTEAPLGERRARS